METNNKNLPIQQEAKKPNRLEQKCINVFRILRIKPDRQFLAAQGIAPMIKAKLDAVEKEYWIIPTNPVKKQTEEGWITEASGIIPIISAKGYEKMIQQLGIPVIVNYKEMYEGLQYIEKDNEIKVEGELKSGALINGYVCLIKWLASDGKWYSSLHMKSKDQMRAFADLHSSSYKSSTSPWKLAFDGMAKQSILKATYKQVLDQIAPLSNTNKKYIQAVRKAIEIDDAKLTEANGKVKVTYACEEKQGE